MIWLVGSGEMSTAYSKVLEALDVNYSVIGRGTESAKSFEQKTGKPVFVGGLKKAISEGLPLPDKAIVSVGVEHLYSTTKQLLECGVRYILVEKPGGLTHQEVEDLAQKSEAIGGNVFIAYNRRFYSSVLAAKELIRSEGGVKSFAFELTEWAHVIGKLDKPREVLEKWFLANSTHVSDMAFFLGGKPKEIASFSSGSLEWHPSASIFSGAGVSESGAVFSYSANWESAGRWGVEILTSENRYVFRPMESLQVQKKGSIQVTEVEVDNRLDVEFKPGLYKQVSAFVTGDFLDLCSIQEQREIFEVYEKMASY